MAKLFASVVFCSCISWATFIYAQTTDAIQGDSLKQETIVPNSVTFRKTSFDLGIGTNGPGIGAKYQLSAKWSLRLGFTTLPLTYSSNYTISGFATHINLIDKATKIHFLAEWRPLPKSILKIIGGVAYFTEVGFTCKMTPNGYYYFGDLRVPGKDIGEINATIDWTGLAPFIGLGFDSPHPKRKIGLSVGIGLYYLAQPQITITGTNFLSGNSRNQPWIAENMASYRYLPSINCHLVYRLKKP